MSFGKDALYRFVGKDSEEDGHALCLGGTGTGKTSGIALPTMETWRGPIFTFDFKGDTTAWAKAMGRNPKVLSLVDVQRNDFYLDPYDLLRKGGESHIIENAREIAGALIPLYPGNEKEAFWVYAARGLLSAALVYYFRLGLDFIETMLVIKARSTENLIKEIENDRLAMMCLPGDLLSSDGQTAGISTDIHNNILDFVSSPTVCDALSASSMEQKSSSRGRSWPMKTSLSESTRAASLSGAARYGLCWYRP